MTTEYTSPPLVEPADEGLADVVYSNAANDPGNAAFARLNSSGEWVDVTAAEFRDEVVEVAKGLLAKGIQPRDRVGLMSRTRYEWTVLDYALWSIGACPVPVYPTSSASQVAWILGDSGAVACVVETEEHAGEVEAARSELSGLREVWCMDRGALDTLADAGRDVSEAEVERLRQAVDPADPATIVYTSGTTGKPKGCVLTHANFHAEVDNAIELLFPVFKAVSRHSPSTLLFLPVAHVLGRMVQIGCVRAGVRVGHQPSISRDELLSALRSFRPTFVVGVPYVFEKVYNSARRTAERIGRASAFDRAASVATRYAEAVEQQLFGRGRGPGLVLRLQHALYDKLVYQRIRGELGGRLHYAICGGSPLGRRLALFFAGADINVYEGYGLTETTAAIAVNPPLAPRFGTVGRPMPGATIRIADDGEILVRGGQVFSAYWNNETATGDALTDGWFRTEDLGDLDADGYLQVTGRKKEILVTNGGKNVVPAPLEDRIRAHPLVSQVLVIGDNRPFIAALVTLDEAAAKDYPDEQQRRDAIQQAVDDANTSVSRAESIRKFTILEGDFTEANGLLTPSWKPKRKEIMRAYADEIEELYKKR
ncbi:AMP-dependent synthetase/ligase [Flindersiella endophytica]